MAIGAFALNHRYPAELFGTMQNGGPSKKKSKKKKHKRREQKLTTIMEADVPEVRSLASPKEIRPSSPR